MSSPDQTHRLYAIGLDVGTSSVKGTVLTSDGETTSARSEPYRSTAPFAGAVEQNPDDWWTAVGTVLAELVHRYPDLGPENATLGLTGQMHTSVMLDSSEQSVRPAILWSDKRAVQECDQLTASVPDILRITGNPVMPAFTVAHLAWVRRNEPEVFSRIAHVLVPKDEIRRRLGAGLKTEPSDASGMGMLDFSTDQWSDPILDAVGLRKEALPTVVPSHAQTGRVRCVPGGSEELQQLVGSPVVGGGGDQSTQAIALGVTLPGKIGISIGTSGVAFSALDAPQAHSFRHAYDRRWLSLNSTHAAGLALSWFSNIVNRSVPDLSSSHVHVERAPLFLPYLQGHRDLNGPPGALVDLDVQHGTADIAYAVMEGVAFELRRLAASIGMDSLPPGAVHLGGGGGRSPQWRSLLANALGRDVVFTDRDSSFGAAAIAAEAAGWLETFERLDRVDPVLTKVDMASADITATRSARFSALAAALAQVG